MSHNRDLPPERERERYTERYTERYIERYIERYKETYRERYIYIERERKLYLNSGSYELNKLLFVRAEYKLNN